LISGAFFGFYQTRRNQAQIEFLEIDMNKKHFLFLLPVCLVFCLWFTTCDEDKEVTDLWEKIRNTVWTNKKTLKHNGEDYVVTHTLGFFKPSNGPFPNNYSNYPYVVIRFIVTGNVPEWWTPGEPYDKFFELQINSTGNIITSVDKWVNYSGKEFSPSFHLSVSGNGEKLSVSGAKLWDIWDAERFVGTYKKVSSGSYDWGDGFGGGDWGNGSNGGGTSTKPDLPDLPDLKEKLFGDYYAILNTSRSNEDILINESILSSLDRKNTNEHLYFSISDWKSAKTPPEYFDDYPNAFKITGRITDAYPQQNNPPSYLYGNKTAPGFTSADINSTECWMYLYFDDYGEELIRTAFSKAGNLNENVITETNNEPRVYRRK
jgi:hypothetical protein